MVALADLDDALVARNAVQPEPPEIVQVVAAQEARRCTRRQDLSAMPSGRDTRGHTCGGADVPRGHLLGLAGVQADPHAWLDAVRPAFAGSRPLCPCGPRGAVLGSVEGHPERLGARGEDVAAVAVAHLPEQLPAPKGQGR